MECIGSWLFNSIKVIAASMASRKACACRHTSLCLRHPCTIPQEKSREWSGRFASLGLNIKEVTGGLRNLLCGSRGGSADVNIWMQAWQGRQNPTSPACYTISPASFHLLTLGRRC